MTRLTTSVLLAVSLSFSANATLSVALDTGPVDQMNGTFAYNYTASLSPDDRLSSAGTFFTIYNVGSMSDFVGVSTSAPGWAASEELIGTGFDRSSVNVTFFYDSSTVVHPNGTVLAINGFQVLSTLDGVNRNGIFVSETLNDPTGPVSIPMGTPEPASLALIGIGLIGLAFARKRFKR